MKRQEKLNLDMQRQLAMQDAKFSMFVEEMRDFKNEMRQRDNQRAEEIRQINLRIDEKFDSIMQQMHNNLVQIVVGVGAIMATIGGIIIAVIK